MKLQDVSHRELEDEGSRSLSNYVPAGVPPILKVEPARVDFFVVLVQVDVRVETALLSRPPHEASSTRGVAPPTCPHG